MPFRFAPRWYWVLVTAALLPLFVSLGLWQWHRGEARRAQWDEFARGDVPAIDASAASLAGVSRYKRVRLSGHYDGERQFLLENMSHAGAPGYQVLTVFTLPEGSRLLVNRGWLPFSGYREQLPDLSLPAEAQGTLTISGRLGALPVAGLASGRAAPGPDGAWPRLTSFPMREQLEAAYGAKFLPPVLLLDADAGPGYLRDWLPGGLPPERHIGYAVQWWAFAVLLLGLFVGFNLKRKHAAEP
jgi:surfeit locus 1 family protein